MHQNNVSLQREFFDTAKTLPFEFRLKQLMILKRMIVDHKTDIISALHQDLAKPAQEALSSEIYILLNEIKHTIKYLKKWMKPQARKTPLFLWPGRSRLFYDPYGCVLIISPWNYPFLLSLLPLIGAICAGNCVTLKPSEISIHSTTLLQKLIFKYFPQEYVCVITGNADVVQSLLKERWDYIFFTGSTQVGKIVATAAAHQLIPYTLELGGKSPCVLDATADLDYAAKRIVWAKFTNAGQICIAPDFVLIDEKIRDKFILRMQYYIQQFYGRNPAHSPYYARIINTHHVKRLVKLIKNSAIIAGGEYEEAAHFIAPTLIAAEWHDEIMQEEIFGPLLPILSFQQFSDIKILKQHAKPLSFYLFSHNRIHIEYVIKHLSFGGGCINDCLVHLTNPHLPFGGVGLSGTGSYRGRFSFETFSHVKSIYQKYTWFDIALPYPPYSVTKIKWIKRFFT